MDDAPAIGMPESFALALPRRRRPGQLFELAPIAQPPEETTATMDLAIAIHPWIQSPSAPQVAVSYPQRRPVLIEPLFQRQLADFPGV